MAEPSETASIDGPSGSESAALRLETRDGIAWLWFDDPNKKVNTLSSRIVDQFEACLARLEAAPPKGLILASGKPETFVAGADLQELRGLSDPGEIRRMLERGHRLCERLHALPCTVVAAIHGACLGGGLELALACHRRVATDYSKTKIGLPEVQLGLIPGLGGTQRLPRLIGVADSLPLILTGKQVNAKKAKRLGIVDEVCQPADLEQAALRLVAQGKNHRTAARPLGTRVINAVAKIPLARNLIFSKARGGVLEKTDGHYPAPLKALEVIARGLTLPLGEALALEAQAYGEIGIALAIEVGFDARLQDQPLGQQQLVFAGQTQCRASTIAHIGGGLDIEPVWSQTLHAEGHPVACGSAETRVIPHTELGIPERCDGMAPQQLGARLFEAPL